MSQDRITPASLPTFSGPELSPSPVEAPLPPHIEGYHIGRLLGSGGMGTVWQATQISTKRSVALKVIQTRFTTSERGHQRFVREIELAARLEHPHIARPDQLLLLGDHNWASQWDPTNLWYCGRTWHQKRHHYNLAFLDGHIVFIKVQKGLLLTDDYRIYPSTDIDPLVSTLQTPVPCVCEVP